jgi:hypothetical protein
VTIDEGDAPDAQPAVLHKAWPIAGLAFAVFVNVLWISVLGYLLVGVLGYLLVRLLA